VSEVEIDYSLESTPDDKLSPKEVPVDAQAASDATEKELISETEDQRLVGQFTLLSDRYYEHVVTPWTAWDIEKAIGDADVHTPQTIESMPNTRRGLWGIVNPSPYAREGTDNPLFTHHSRPSNLPVEDE